MAWGLVLAFPVLQRGNMEMSRPRCPVMVTVWLLLEIVVEGVRTGLLTVCE